MAHLEHQAIFDRMGFPFDVSPDRVRWVALLAAIVGMIVCGVAGYHALSNEITGTAVYYKATGSRGSLREPVTRETSPAKFREASNWLWYISGFSLVVAVLGVVFYRKLADSSKNGV